MMALSKRTLTIILLTTSVSATLSIFFFPPIEQDISYHQFADQRSLLAIPNFWNVISNVTFLIVGLIGVFRLHKNKLHIISSARICYSMFFIAIIAVSLGSVYYHWQPDNMTLVFDRLPMSFAFMSLLSIVLAECISESWGRISLLPLLLIGLLSVGYWYWGMLHESGDLRWYALIQFLPLLFLLLLLVFGQSEYRSQSGYWWLFITYLLAKAAEHFDVEIFRCTAKIISGHTLKHLFSAAGLYVLIVFLKKREKRHIDENKSA
jgi:Ceramidase